MHSHRAVQGPAGSERDAVVPKMLTVLFATVVEGAPQHVGTRAVPLEERWLFSPRPYVPGKPITTPPFDAPVPRTADAAGIKEERAAGNSLRTDKLVRDGVGRLPGLSDFDLQLLFALNRRPRRQGRVIDVGLQTSGNRNAQCPLFS